MIHLNINAFNILHTRRMFGLPFWILNAFIHTFIHKNKCDKSKRLFDIFCLILFILKSVHVGLYVGWRTMDGWLWTICRSSAIIIFSAIDRFGTIFYYLLFSLVYRQYWINGILLKLKSWLTTYYLLLKSIRIEHQSKSQIQPKHFMFENEIFFNFLCVLNT